MERRVVGDDCSDVPAAAHAHLEGGRASERGAEHALNGDAIGRLWQQRQRSARGRRLQGGGEARNLPGVVQCDQVRWAAAEGGDARDERREQERLGGGIPKHEDVAGRRERRIQSSVAPTPAAAHLNKAVPERRRDDSRWPHR